MKNEFSEVMGSVLSDMRGAYREGNTLPVQAQVARFKARKHDTPDGLAKFMQQQVESGAVKPEEVDQAMADYLADMRAKGAF